MVSVKTLSVLSEKILRALREQKPFTQIPLSKNTQSPQSCFNIIQILQMIIDAHKVN